MEMIDRIKEQATIKLKSLPPKPEKAASKLDEAKADEEMKEEPPKHI